MASAPATATDGSQCPQLRGIRIARHVVHPTATHCEWHTPGFSLARGLVLARGLILAPHDASLYSLVLAPVESDNGTQPRTVTWSRRFALAEEMS